MKRNWTGKLQVTLLFVYIFWKKVCSHTFKASFEKVTVKLSEKIKVKKHKGECLKEFFL